MENDLSLIIYVMISVMCIVLLMFTMMLLYITKKESKKTIKIVKTDDD